MRQCAALLITAPASGQGKTTVTAALARRYRDRGQRVRVFKTGPDFLDPMILEAACGEPVYTLDLWMGGQAHCRRLLYDAAGEVDLVLVEGVMGLFDGDPSSADVARLFGIPVLAVIDGSAMAQTFGALAHGLSTYRADVPFAGVFANRIASEGHYRLLVGSLPPELPGYGWMPRDAEIALPERHLGLVQATEIADLDSRISKAAHALHLSQEPLALQREFADPAEVADPVDQESDSPRGAFPLAGTRIAVARDAAFAFLYRENIAVLRALGAEVTWFSPLADTALPPAEALYLPGGYPELYLERLAANADMKSAIRGHQRAGKPIFAECGGLLYLLEALTDAQGRSAPMVGLLAGTATMLPRLANLGLHRVALPEGEMRGHTFHYSSLACALTPQAWSQAAKGHGHPEPVFREGRLTATYLHLFFPSNPGAAAGLFAP